MEPKPYSKLIQILSSTLSQFEQHNPPSPEASSYLQLKTSLRRAITNIESMNQLG